MTLRFRPPLWSILPLCGLLLAGCDDSADGPAGPEGTTRLHLSAVFPYAASGGDGDAYDAADRIRIRLSAAEGPPLVDEVRPFTPSDTGSVLALEVDVDRGASLLLEVELRRGENPLFRAETDVALAPGRTTEATLELRPVPAELALAEPVGPLTSIGETAPLEGFVRFATGDTARSLAVGWTALDPAVAEVDDSADPVLARAVADGIARMEAAHGGLFDTLTVTVELQVAAVEVSPETSTIPLGGSVQLLATAFDARGNELQGRVPEWTSDPSDVASVDGDGLVQGVGVGTATVTGTIEGAEGTATVEVTPTAPDAQTDPAEDVGRTSATVRGVTNPNGAETTVFFEWGTDPSLEGAATTPPVPAGSGISDVALEAELAELSPGTPHYYRIVATNEVGTAEGDIRRFDTVEQPPPAAVTLPAAGVTTTGATLHGEVDPRGAETMAWFEWSTDPSLTEAVTTEPVAVGSGVEPVALEAPLTGLEPETDHFYRVAASNLGGTAEGEIVSFRTDRPPPTDLAVRRGGTSNFLDWRDNSSTETSFRIERSLTSPSSGFSGLASVGANVTLFEHTPLPVGAVYYRVRACVDGGCTEPSNTVEVVVPAPLIRGTVTHCDFGGDCSPRVGQVVDLDGPVNRTTTTDSQGRYTFPNLPDDTYTVSVTDTPCQVRFDPEARDVSVSGGGDEGVADFEGVFIVC